MYMSSAAVLCGVIAEPAQHSGSPVLRPLNNAEALILSPTLSHLHNYKSSVVRCLSLTTGGVS